MAPMKSASPSSQSAFLLVAVFIPILLIERDRRPALPAEFAVTLSAAIGVSP